MYDLCYLDFTEEQKERLRKGEWVVYIRNDQAFCIKLTSK